MLLVDLTVIDLHFLLPFAVDIVAHHNLCPATVRCSKDCGECIVEWLQVQKMGTRVGNLFGFKEFFFWGGVQLFACVVVCAAKTDKSVASLVSTDSVLTVWLIHLVVRILPPPVQNVS
jgi:hypothetical protein